MLGYETSGAGEKCYCMLQTKGGRERLTGEWASETNRAEQLDIAPSSFPGVPLPESLAHGGGRRGGAGARRMAERLAGSGSAASKVVRSFHQRTFSPSTEGGEKKKRDFKFGFQPN
ncbi:hypothetical protein NL676_022350 [Syzygium grande]|nr:hypothetical protein NL676_022350 [Syzygium grande]